MRARARACARAFTRARARACARAFTRACARSRACAPVEAVHPLTLRYLEERGYQTADLRSQSWHDLEVFHPDRVVTVCDSAAGEICPLWMGEVEKHHWGLPDPSRVEGDEAAIRSAFMTVIDRIEDKVDEWLRECGA